jgi:hypothetical protein
MDTNAGQQLVDSIRLKLQKTEWWRSPVLASNERVFYGCMLWWGMSSNCGSTADIASNCKYYEREVFSWCLRSVDLIGYSKIFQEHIIIDKLKELWDDPDGNNNDLAIEALRNHAERHGEGLSETQSEIIILQWASTNITV